MQDQTRGGVGGGVRLAALAAAACLVAWLSLASTAEAAVDPVASGSTTVALNPGLAKQLKKHGVKVVPVSPASGTGTTITLPVASGSVDPTTGQGSVAHSGEIRFEKGRRSASLSAVVIDTKNNSVSGSLNGTPISIALLAGATPVRNGFGVSIAIGGLNLTADAAGRLNRTLGLVAKRKRKKKGKRAAGGKQRRGKAGGLLKANQSLGSASTTSQPLSLGVLAQGSVSLAVSAGMVKKLEAPPPDGDGVKIVPVAPTVRVPGTFAGAPVLSSPVTGGTILPAGIGGEVQTGGGLKLVQELGPEDESSTSFEDFRIELSDGRISAEMEEHSTLSPALDVGSLGRVSFVTVDLAGAQIVSDPVARTVRVEGAPVRLGGAVAGLLDQLFGYPYDFREPPIAHPTFAGGEVLGTISFTAQTE